MYYFACEDGLPLKPKRISSNGYFTYIFRSMTPDSITGRSRFQINPQKAMVVNKWLLVTLPLKTIFGEKIQYSMHKTRTGTTTIGFSNHWKRTKCMRIIQLKFYRRKRRSFICRSGRNSQQYVKSYRSSMYIAYASRYATCECIN